MVMMLEVWFNRRVAGGEAAPAAGALGKTGRVGN
jgi:hypothetical protein